MKKIVFIFLGLLCIVFASASPIRVTGTVNYGSAYRGSGHGGLYTTSSARMKSVGSYGGQMAQAPVASMASTSRTITPDAKTKNISAPQITGIRTSASAISGGVTTYDDGPRNGRVRKIHLPGTCEHCDWEWDDEKDDYVCIYCGCELMNGCECGDCHCPIGDGKDVWLFMAAIAAAYITYKNVSKRQTKRQEYAQTTNQ